MECLGGPKEEDLAVIIEREAAHELAKSTKGIKGKNFWKPLDKIKKVWYNKDTVRETPTE